MREKERIGLSLKGGEGEPIFERRFSCSHHQKSTAHKMKLRSQQYYSMMAFAVLTVVLLFANAFVTTYIVLTLKLYKVGEEELDLNLAPSINQSTFRAPCSATTDGATRACSTPPSTPRASSPRAEAEGGSDCSQTRKSCSAQLLEKPLTAVL